MKGQAYLFGEKDFIINTIEAERTAIEKDIKGTIKSVEKKKEKLEELEERKANLTKAFNTLNVASVPEKLKSKETKKKK